MPGCTTSFTRRGVFAVLFAALLAVSLSTAGLTAAATAPPPNDDFDNALVVTAIPYRDAVEVVGATTAANDPTPPCLGERKYNTVWYRYTPTTDQTLVFNTSSSSYSPTLVVWTGTLGHLTSRSCSSARQQKIALAAGTTYHIEVVRAATYIGDQPTSLKLVFEIIPDGTLPGPLRKAGPADQAPHQSTRVVLRWEPSDYAANYAYCYDTIDNGTCDKPWSTTLHTDAAPTGLTQGTTYYWQVRAENLAGNTEADGGRWWSFTTAAAADLNRWSGTTGADRAMGFDLLTDGSQWLNFSVTLSYQACSGATKVATITTGGPGVIDGASLGQAGAFAFGGVFGSNTAAAGWYRLTDYPICDWIAIPGYCCWAITSASGSWSASGPPRLPIRSVYLPMLVK